MTQSSRIHVLLALSSCFLLTSTLSNAAQHELELNPGDSGSIESCFTLTPHINCEGDLENVSYGNGFLSTSLANTMCFPGTVDALDTMSRCPGTQMSCEVAFLDALGNTVGEVQQILVTPSNEDTHPPTLVGVPADLDIEA